MTNWNYNMSEAPKGSYREVAIGKGTRKIHEPVRIIAAAPDSDVVTISNWLPDQERWNMFTKERPPIAWAPWPEHPGEPK